MGISYTERSTLSVRLLRVRLERSLLCGFVRICWIELWSTINGFFDGVLYTLSTMFSLAAPIRAWPGWMPVKLSFAIVPDDSCEMMSAYRASPCGTLCGVDCDLGPNLELDSDFDAAEPSSDIQGQRRMTSR